MRYKLLGPSGLRIEPGFPYELLQGQMVYGDRGPQIDLPPAAPIRRR